ncbi:hypothetical protein KDA00_03045 [Candidatus Saccharibacteria bacterium]|nr:hypothetical protein [Candidatus Saccharibacteria bacterium]
MNATEKILYLLSQIETANQLSADSQPCFLDPDAIDKDKVTRLELKTILEKLAADGVIRILEKPTGNVIRTDRPNYSNYKIEVLPTFDDYYDTTYASNRFGVKNLTHDNYYRVYAVAELINQELNIRTDGIATFEADKSTATLWKGVHEKSLSLYHIKQIYSKALRFLKEVGAINSYELYKPSPSSTTQLYKVTASRRRFDAVFLELIVNSPNSKTAALTKKLVINKEPKPQPNYPDDAPAHFEDDIAEKKSNSKPEPEEKSETAAATSEQERLILFMAVVGKTFGDNDQKPISLPFSSFKPLSFKQVNEFVDQYAGSKTFIVKSRPKSATDKQPYELELTEHQKTAFEELKNNLGHLRDMQMLMIFWGKICEVYDAMSFGYVGFEDGLLNRSYLLLTIRIDKILAQDEFAKLREEKPSIYDTFMGNMEDLDIGYEFMRPELWGFYGKLERLWVEKADGVGAFKLEEDEQRILDDTDKAIAEHRKEKARLNANFEKRLEKTAAKYNQEPKPDTPNKEPAKDQPNTKSEPKPEPSGQDKVRFDAKASKLTFTGKTCEIPDETIEHYMCKLVFRNRRVAAKEDDILEYSPKSQDSQRAVYDAHLRVNKRVKNDLGIDKLLKFKAGKVRIQTKYQ